MENDDSAWAAAARAAQAALVLADAGGRIRALNPAAAALFRLDPAAAGALAGRPLGALLAGGTGAFPALPDGPAVEATGRRGDDTDFAVELALARDGAGGLALACRGVAGAGEAEGAFLQTLVDDQEELVIRSDADFRIRFCNLAVCRFFDLPREALTGRRFTPGMTAEEEAALAADLASLTPERPWRRSVDAKRRPSGETRLISWSNRALFDAVGRPTGHLSIGRDVTEELRMREALTLSEARMAAFAENAPVALFMQDGAGRYVLVNAEAEAVFGRRRAEILGRDDAAAPAALARAGAEAEAEMRRAGRPVRAECSLAPEGRPYHAAMQLRFPVPGPCGEGGWSGGFLLDVTARRRAEAELAEARDALARAERMNVMGALLAGVAHELNNPLAVVVAQASMLEQDAGDGPLAARAARIQRAAARAGRIVQTFLDLARQRPGERRRLALAPLAEAASEVLAYAARSGGVTLALDLGATAEVDGDPGLLSQATTTLLAHVLDAAQRVSPPLAARLAIGAEGGEAWIEAAAGAPRGAFRDYRPEAGSGSTGGAGLVFCHGVVAAHGGRMETAGSVGADLAFRMRLPALPPATAFAAGEAGPAGFADAEPAPARALVVDDDEALADTLADLLATGGWEVDLATSAAEAQGLIAAGGHALILSDLRMPGMDGPALFRWLAAEHPALVARVAFVTGDTLGETAASFLAEAGRPALEKPFSRAEVLELAARIRDG